MFDMSGHWHALIDGIAAHAVQPVLSWLHVSASAMNPLEVAEAVLISVIQLVVIGLVFRPLESLAPAERWADRRLAAVDRNYTLLMLMGLLPLFSFLILSPFGHLFGTEGSGTAEPAGGLRQWVPWFNDHPWLLFAAYYLVYDLTYYGMHRLQHAVPWWWALHSLHHSQRQLSCWSDDRDSYIDGAMQALVLASVGVVMGVDPAEFALLTLIGELMQKLSHANVRWGFGFGLDRILVGPRFHRLHHMRKDPLRPHLHNCNFGQVLAVWDVLFRTALYGEPVRPTGVNDPMVDADNEHGLIAQQWCAFRRFWGSVRCREGWRLGEVAFSPTFVPLRCDSSPVVPPNEPALYSADAGR